MKDDDLEWIYFLPVASSASSKSKDSNNFSEEAATTVTEATTTASATHRTVVEIRHARTQSCDGAGGGRKGRRDANQQRRSMAQHGLQVTHV